MHQRLIHIQNQSFPSSQLILNRFKQWCDFTFVFLILTILLSEVTHNPLLFHVSCGWNLVLLPRNTPLVVLLRSRLAWISFRSFVTFLNLSDNAAHVHGFSVYTLGVLFAFIRTLFAHASLRILLTVLLGLRNFGFILSLNLHLAETVGFHYGGVVRGLPLGLLSDVCLVHGLSLVR